MPADNIKPAAEERARKKEKIVLIKRLFYPFQPSSVRLLTFLTVEVSQKTETLFPLFFLKIKMR